MKEIIFLNVHSHTLSLMFYLKSLPVVLFSSSYFLGYFYICVTVKCVSFTTNLTLFRRKKTTSALTPSSMTPLLLALLLFGLLSVEFPENYLPLIFIFPNPEYGFMLSSALKFMLALKFRKTLIQLLFTILSIYIFHLAISPIASILCIMVFQNWCHSCTQKKPPMATNFTHNPIKLCFSESRTALS